MHQPLMIDADIWSVLMVGNKIDEWKEWIRSNSKCFPGISSTVKLSYNEHGYNEFTAITNKSYWYFWSQIATLLHKSSQL